MERLVIYLTNKIVLIITIIFTYVGILEKVIKIVWTLTLTRKITHVDQVAAKGMYLFFI